MPQSHHHCLKNLTTNSLPPLVMTKPTHPPMCLLFSPFNFNLAQSAIALGKVLVWLEKKLTWRFWQVCCCFQMFVLFNNLMTTTVLPYSSIPALKSVMTVKHCLLHAVNHHSNLYNRHVSTFPPQVCWTILFWSELQSRNDWYSYRFPGSN